MNDLLVILGPTAVGKTKLAIALADQLQGEVISADSRQVYKGMDIGTGKDLDDFEINESTIQHHLIDIRAAGEEYHLFDFQQDFYEAFGNIQERKKIPILCGGTGLYLEAALAKEKMVEVPQNTLLRVELNKFSQIELNKKLQGVQKNLHNSTDLEDRERTIRAIEIALFKQQVTVTRSPVKKPCLFGIQMEREALRSRIEERMKDRLENGMIEEVEQLMQQGLTAEKLYYYGLEYRFIGAYLKKEISYEEMYATLLQAIRRFAKKQMTWYRRMEKKGHSIHWMEASLSLEEKMNQITTALLKNRES